MRLFLDASVVLAACGRPAGASHAVFDLAAFYDEDEDEIILRRVKGKGNWLEIMKQCPVPMDDLPPRSREMPKKLKL